MPALVPTMGMAQARGWTLVPEDSSMSRVEEGFDGMDMPGISSMSIATADDCCWLEGGVGAGICICAVAAGTRRIRSSAITRQIGHMRKVCQICAAEAKSVPW